MNVIGTLILYGKVKPLLKGYGLSFDKGITVLVESEEEFVLADRAFKKMQGCGCREYKNVKRKLSLECNNLIMIHKYSRLDRSSDIIDYLESEEFLPIVLTSGWVPDVLRSCSYVVPLSYHEISDIVNGTLIDEISGMVSFIAAHMDYVQLNIERFSKSVSALYEKRCCYWFHIGMKAILTIYHAYLPLIYPEDDAREMAETLQRTLEGVLDYTEQAIEPVDILDAVVKCVWQYVENERVIVCSSDEVGGELLEALEKDCGMMYENGYYLIPEQLFRQMCSPLLSIVSMGEIKYRMAEAGVLIHNKGISANNYTIKKVYYTSFGEIKRKRFIKLVKNVFQMDNALTLEEIGGNSYVYRENAGLICYDGS